MSISQKVSMCFNASTNVVGGTVQNSANFMVYAAEDPDVDWIFVASPQVVEEARNLGFSHAVKCLELSPAHSRASRRELLKYVKEKKSRLVYTMAGPAYVQFPVCHVMGCSNPYLTNLDWISLRHDRTPLEIFLMVARTAYQAFYIRKANAWIFQTESSRQGFMKRFFVSHGMTNVVPNALGRAFGDRGCEKLPNFDKEIIEGIYPAASYPHKAHKIIPDVLFVLKGMGLPYKVKIKVTLVKGSKGEKRLFDVAEKRGVSDCIENIGPFSYVDAPKILNEAEFVFFPSILEVFSTSYIEAMAEKRPLVVTDKDFSREICGPNAFYFKPLSARQAALMIVELIDRAKYEGLGHVIREDISDIAISYSERYSKIKNALLSRVN